MYAEHLGAGEAQNPAAEKAGSFCFEKLKSLNDDRLRFNEQSMHSIGYALERAVRFNAKSDAYTMTFGEDFAVDQPTNIAEVQKILETRLKQATPEDAGVFAHCIIVQRLVGTDERGENRKPREHWQYGIKVQFSQKPEDKYGPGLKAAGRNFIDTGDKRVEWHDPRVCEMVMLDVGQKLRELRFDIRLPINEL